MEKVDASMSNHYIHIHKSALKEPLRIKKFPRLKELRDIMGGEAAWENADSMEEQCTREGLLRNVVLRV